MSVRIRKRDNGYGAMVARLAELKKGPGVSVGVHAREGAATHKQRVQEGRELSVVDIAAINEFGLGVPERSWLRAWFDESQNDNRETLRQLAKMALTGEKTVEQALELAGLRFVGAIQKRIAAGISPPNAPATIKAKGSSTPLIDLGQLRQSITHLVRKLALKGA